MIPHEKFWKSLDHEEIAERRAAARDEKAKQHRKAIRISITTAVETNEPIAVRIAS